jgi:type I restriction enzyme S subunit
MEKYNKYKDSGIEWLLDKIPSHWKTKRIKDLCKMQSGFYISANDFKDEGFPIYGGNGFRGFSEDYNHDGEYTLVGRQGALCGNINYAKGKFWATEHAIVVYEKKGVNKFWFGELLRLMNLNQYSLSAAQPGLSVEKIKRLKLPFIPSLEEQTQIANYLDAKTTAIDKKVSLLQQKIKHYKAYRKTLINETVTKGLDKTVKLKDSGIDWIGEIPEHWEVKRLKDVSKIFTGNSISDKSLFEINKDAYNYIATKDINIHTKGVNYDNGVYIPKIDKSFKVTKRNTSLICLEGASAGKKLTFVDREVTFVNKLCAIKSFDKNVFDKYIFYLLQTNMFNSQFFELLSGLIGGVSLGLLKYFNILVPAINEQQQIANYLDAKTATIDKIVKNIETQIATLKELRKTLINEVVTGKVKVSA